MYAAKPICLRQIVPGGPEFFPVREVGIHFREADKHSQAEGMKGITFLILYSGFEALFYDFRELIFCFDFPAAGAED